MHIGRYEVLEELAVGGMGWVRLARDPRGRLVVLKTALRGDDDDDERLRDEARVGLRMHHPSLVETLELFETDLGAGRLRPVLVTGYVPGLSMLELRRAGPVSPLVVCHVGKQLAEALDAIHHAKADSGAPLNVLHRDVTAGNCLVGHDGRARLIDLGISRSSESRAMRTETGLLRGTLRYLAPELFDGGAYSVASDLWALGVVLWEALVGRTAVSGSDAVAVGRICTGNLMQLEDGEHVEPRVAKAIGQLLKKKPGDRPRRAREAAALFAMLEKQLAAEAGQSGEAAAQAAVWRIVGGPDVDGATVVVRGMSLDEDNLTATGAVARLAELPPTMAESTSTKTPSQSLADYAASLLHMEKALAQAWERADAADRATLASLPVVRGTALEDAPPTPSPDVVDAGALIAAFVREETGAWPTPEETSPTASAAAPPPFAARPRRAGALVVVVVGVGVGLAVAAAVVGAGLVG